MSVGNQVQKSISERVYNIPVGNKLPNSSHAMRNPQSVNGLLYQPLPGVLNLQDLIQEGLKVNSQYDFVGTKNPKTGVYEYEKYQDIYDQAVALGSSFQNYNLLKVSNDHKNFRFYNNLNQNFDGTLKMVGIYCKNRREWTISDFANALYGFTMVPLYDTLGPESASYILGHSGILTCICSTQQIDILSKATNLHDLKYIISIDEDLSVETQQTLQNRGIKILKFKDLIDQGRKQLVPLPKNLPSDTIFSFSYTSGTTGNPKGAMITHRNLISIVCSQQRSESKFDNKDVFLSYLPLPHIYERFVQVTCWFTGTKIAYYGGDMLKLREDFAAAQPTVAIFVPRLLNKFYEEINAFISRMPQAQQNIIQKAIQEKMQNLQKKETYTFHHPIYDEQIFSKFKNMFGGKLRSMNSGAAPISQKVLDFFKVIFSCNVAQGYGQTEGTGMETSQVMGDIEENNVGGIVSSIEIKLEDVPDMGYLSTDKDEFGNPMPRGEICIRGHSVFAGYYKDDQKTNETFDSDGWMHSGDIGAILPSGALRIIDRKKNLFKLQQGEYVSPEKIENIYIRARGVQEAFVHGDSLQTYCIAVIVPKPDEIVKIAQELNIKEQKIEVLCQNQQVNQFYLNTIQDFGKKEGLFSFEQAQKIHLEPVSLAVHGCLTSSFKLQRHIAKQIFKKVIDELYSKPLQQKQSPRL
ncbi:AMP-binding enzyme family protein (macronuclear) [Tetrahymena thermophila SB210]|uniref:AMP-binding enzyme family protein n=1 Tax=Tetrahymena thermophila (strain SB210) TaxID=312017 RepID=Q237B8_TETTS|nr:AMP-binding enzyme family protein [Tetrahymena thermophila SB210]EAR92332.1 AMP-binding enzyme family protein [Tetrahymena thermophila SB210]|eukprot:XP_001012577.1 AMP-binding enzyme family protein [Tetrahymena thermophila SB210]